MPLLATFEGTRRSRRRRAFWRVFLRVALAALLAAGALDVVQTSTITGITHFLRLAAAARGADRAFAVVVCRHAVRGGGAADTAVLDAVRVEHRGSLSGRPAWHDRRALAKVFKKDSR